MAKLSEAMIKGLRAIADGGGGSAPARTVQALRSRGLVRGPYEGQYVPTLAGRDTLDRIEREAERLSRPVPAGAFVEPAARRAPVLDHEYEDDYEADPAAYERAVEQHTGPSVRLTPAPADTKSEATDAEVLQLLAVLDAGGIVHRALYQEYGVTDAGPFRLNLEAVNRAARDAVRFDLVRQTFTNHEYVLTVEPIHLDTETGATACARYTGERAGGSRLRVTTDPDKVTHERCKR